MLIKFYVDEIGFTFNSCSISSVAMNMPKMDFLKITRISLKKREIYIVFSLMFKVDWMNKEVKMMYSTIYIDGN